ncbi:MAG: hypothetical protein RI580_18290 [Halothece sp. Uz-M2-17]|nr:hypothetical protein [Halothece sp. Uz-M2-17]
MKHKPMKLLGLLGVTTAATFVGVGEAYAVPVALDTFEVSSPQVTPSSPTTDVTGSTNEIIGGSREVELNSGAQTSSSVSSGELEVNSDNDSTGGTDIGSVTLYYDGTADGSFVNNTNGLGSLDLTDSGNNTGIKFEVTELFFAEVDMTLYESDGTPFNATKSINGSDIFFEFASDFSGFDATDLGAAELTLSGSNASQSPSIGAIGATPSIGDPVDPAPVPFEAETSIALALLGGWGAWKRWKTRHAQSNVN